MVLPIALATPAQARADGEPLEVGADTAIQHCKSLVSTVHVALLIATRNLSPTPPFSHTHIPSLLKALPVSGGTMDPSHPCPMIAPPTAMPPPAAPNVLPTRTVCNGHSRRLSAATKTSSSS